VVSEVLKLNRRTLVIPRADGLAIGRARPKSFGAGIDQRSHGEFNEAASEQDRETERPVRAKGCSVDSLSSNLAERVFLHTADHRSFI
jgi:hypothetical protein